jgi:hypothetical protein
MPKIIVYPFALCLILGELVVISLESLTEFLPFKIPSAGTVLRAIGLKKD